MAFFGSLRMGELLTDSSEHFDPSYHCLTEDVVLKDEVIQLKIKAAKEERSGKEIIIDIFKNEGDCCPVRALKKWREMKQPRGEGKPAFRFKNGTPLTKRRFNNLLSKCLNHHIPAGTGFYAGHSFRAGIPSMLGELGYSTEDIMTVGRWSSNAYEAYVKMPRTKRQEMSRKVAAWKK